MYALLLAAVVAFHGHTHEKPRAESPVIFTIDEGPSRWLLLGLAEITSAYGSHSPSNALALTGSGTNEGSQGILFLHPDLDIVAGEVYRISAWVKADAADESTPISFSVEGQLDTPGHGPSGALVYPNPIIYKSQIGPGWQRVELGIFTNQAYGDDDPIDPVTAFVAATMANQATQTTPIPPAPPNIGRWLVDDISIETPGDDMAKRSRWLAHARLVQVLKGINGAAGGYHLDLGSRVYTKYIRPQGSTHPPLPYLCVPLVNTAPKVQHEGTFIRHTWTLPIMAFVAEANVGAYESVAIAQLYHLGEDVYRAVMQDPTLNGTVRPVSFVSGGIEEGGISPFDGLPYADAVIPIELSIDLALDVLGP